jgi:hypothetical protein
MEAKMTAVHDDKGVWNFTCYYHPQPLFSRGISSPEHALQFLRYHADKEHVGVRLRIRRTSQYSPAYSGSYTGRPSQENCPVCRRPMTWFGDHWRCTSIKLHDKVASRGKGGSR